MRVTILKCALSGDVRAIPSKSDAHRKLICAFLADRDTAWRPEASSQDIEATIRCLNAIKDGGVLHCGESGSTLRFMLPLVSALGRGGEIRAAEGLARRPNAPLVAELNKNGAEIQGESPPYKISGQLKSGRFVMPGNVSSQYISGLLMALPLLSGFSEIVMASPLESGRYVDMTISVLRGFGVEVEKTSEGYRVRGPQRFTMPKSIEVEGDWSNAAFFLAANRMGSEVSVSGLDNNSLQPDRGILSALNQMGGEIDVSEAPDLAPILSVCATQYEGTTRIMNAGRLRYKESDRLSAMAANLTAIGADVREGEDSLTIRGGKLTGGLVSGHNDHRIVMAMAIAGTVCDDPLIIEGAEAVDKSYPDFFRDFARVGGRFHVQ